MGSLFFLLSIEELLTLGIRNYEFHTNEIQNIGKNYSLMEVTEEMLLNSGVDNSNGNKVHPLNFFNLFNFSAHLYEF